MHYEWDDQKNAANIAKHGVTFEMVETFDWKHALIVEDDRADYGEIRYVAMGQIHHRLYVLIYTQRGHARRVISLRKANKREENIYATQT